MEIIPSVELVSSYLSSLFVGDENDITTSFSNAFSTFKYFPFGTTSSSHLNESASSISISFTSTGERSGFLRFED